MSVDLASFLLERIEEDERHARIAKHLWEAPPGTPRHATFRVAATPQPMPIVAVDHVTRHDPARVLAECEAKRRIVELHKPHEATANFEHWNRAEQRLDRWRGVCCDECGHVDANPTPWPCETLCILAAPFSDHPGFREEWAI